MTAVRLDPRQTLARAELLLAADFGREARGRPIHGRPESEDGGAGEPGPWLKLGAVRTPRLAVSEGTDRPSASAYGNPLGGTRDDAPVVPVGAPLVARTDVPDARSWRVYRVAPNGAVICDGGAATWALRRCATGSGRRSGTGRRSVRTTLGRSWRRRWRTR